MKKLLCISILLLICHGGIYYIYYFFAVAQAKWHAATVIHRDDATQNYLKVPSSSIADPDEDELWYRGNLYDVADRKLVHDTLYLYLYRDQDEEDLTADCSNFIRDQTGLSGTWSFEAGHKKGTLFNPNINYIDPGMARLRYGGLSSGKRPIEQSSALAFVAAEVLIPPPKPVS